jgi:hypothetical protein
MAKQAKLEKWEAALIKGMIAAKQPKTNQDILAYFKHSKLHNPSRLRMNTTSG